MRLNLGEIVCVIAGIPSFESRTGCIVHISEPAITITERKEEALLEMPLYSVRLDDGRRFRFRGRDLRPLGSLARTALYPFRRKLPIPSS
jgi:hypothetical protein